MNEWQIGKQKKNSKMKKTIRKYNKETDFIEIIICFLPFKSSIWYSVMFAMSLVFRVRVWVV